jgi:hypothetical protein
MPPAYLELAFERFNESHSRYRQPEHYGYDFREWVSPYTKGAHRIGGIAIVLQDWASEDGLLGEVNTDIQALGRNPLLRTNRVLEELLKRVFGIAIQEAFVTNAFPLVKPGGMSSQIPLADFKLYVERYAKRELRLVQPTSILALGSLTFRALSECGVVAVPLPHPAARIGSVDAHERIWRAQFGFT